MKTSRRAPASISHARWLTYATAGAATALAAIPSAEGEIHYSGLINEKFNAHDIFYLTVSDTFQLDQPGNSFRLIQHKTDSLYYGWAFFTMLGIGTEAFAGKTLGDRQHHYVERVHKWQNISTRPTFVSGEGRGILAGSYPFIWSQFDRKGVGYIGFRFNSGNGVQYGWIRLRMYGAPHNRFILADYAWADPGESIQAGQKSSTEMVEDTDRTEAAEAVPSSGSLGLLALGSLGLLAWRERRAKSASGISDS